MSGDDQHLPAEIEMEVGRLISQLSVSGWVISAFRYDAKVFGNWFVDLQRDGLAIRLVKDRSQYFVDQLSSEEIKVARLWKAFDNLQEFHEAIIEGLKAYPTSGL